MSSDENERSTARSQAPPETAEDAADGVESWLVEAAQISHVSVNGAAARRASLPALGSLVGQKYRLDGIIGEGGMGAVFRATHLVSGKAVALKWMLRSGSHEASRRRFTREARAAGRIDHPNVVDVYDIGEEGDSAYLVMELLHGASLRERLRTAEPLGPTEVVDLLLPAMRGVAAAHAAGVVHRDLKPDNIFLCRAPDGAKREAKVLDFGISTVTASESTADATLTKEGTVLGTPAYMSPEQLRSASEADQRSDVYSFGVILYEALSGRVPFRADSYSALVLAIANEKPASIRERRPEVPRSLEKVVLRAMSGDASERFQSMQEMVDALVPFGSVPTGSGAQPVVAAGARGAGGRVVAVAALVLAGVAAWWWSAASSVESLVEEPAPAAPSVVHEASAMPAPVPLPAEPPLAPIAPGPVAAPAEPPSAAPTAPTVTPAREASKRSRPSSSAVARPKPSQPATASSQLSPAAPVSDKARSGAISLDQL